MSTRPIRAPVVRESPGVYRPRRPERTPFTRLVTDHYATFAVVHDDVLNEEPARLAHMARYALRPPIALARVYRTEDGRVLLTISAITAPAIVDHSAAPAASPREQAPVEPTIGRWLRHLETHADTDEFDARAPPGRTPRTAGVHPEAVRTVPESRLPCRWRGSSVESVARGRSMESPARRKP